MGPSGMPVPLNLAAPWKYHQLYLEPLLVEEPNPPSISTVTLSIMVTASLPLKPLP